MNDEDLQESLNRMFDERVRHHVEEAVERHSHLIDKMVRDRLNAVAYDPVMSKELEARIRRDAESAADHHIRLFGGSPAIHEVVEKLWDQSKERYIKGEVERRLKEAMRAIQKALQVNSQETP